MIMTNTMHELIPIITNQKSFYGKAKIMVSDVTAGHIETLYSYNTPVITYSHNYDTGVKILYRHWNGWSNTTGRHIKEFSRCINPNGINKAEYEKIPYIDYTEFTEAIK